MKNIIRSLSVVVALLLVMTLSFSVLAEESSAAVSDTSVEASEDASADVSANESKDESAEASKDASKDVSTEASKAEDDHDHDHDHSNEQQPTPVVDETPWARIITLIVIVVLILVAFILTKTNTKLGQRIKKFCKEYWSEIKKVSWCSPKETAKATGIVLVFIIVAALVISLLDLGFAWLINKLAEIF